MKVIVRRRPAPTTGYELVGDCQSLIAEANAFLETIRLRGLSPHTVRAYAYDLATLVRWLAAHHPSFRALRQSELLEFVGIQRDLDLGPATINRRLTVCLLVYRFCTGQEMPWGAGASGPAPYYKGQGRDRYLGLHPRRRRRRPRLQVKVPRKLVEPLTPKQVRRFLRSLRRYRDLACVHLMLLCGLRSREVLLLELSDVVVRDRYVRIQGKGDKERVVPLPELLGQILGDYLRLERPGQCRTSRLFVVLQGPHRGQPMTSAGLRSLFRYRRRDPALAMANPHRFRHTFGADMARAGVRLPILQRLMGHADSVSTLRYIQLSMADIAEEYRRAISAIKKRYGTTIPE